MLQETREIVDIILLYQLHVQVPLHAVGMDPAVAVQITFALVSRVTLATTVPYRHAQRAKHGGMSRLQTTLRMECWSVLEEAYALLVVALVKRVLREQRVNVSLAPLTAI